MGQNCPFSFTLPLSLSFSFAPSSLSSQSLLVTFSISPSAPPLHLSLSKRFKFKFRLVFPELKGHERVLVLGSLELCGAVARRRAGGEPSTSEHAQVTKAPAAQREELTPYKKQHPRPALGTHSTKESKTPHTKPKNPNHTLRNWKQLTKTQSTILSMIMYDKRSKISQTINKIQFVQITIK